MERTIVQRNTQLNEDVIKRIKEGLYLPLHEKDKMLKKRCNEEHGSRNREEYQRDYTRILYSSAFRRLQGKMQLLAMDGNNFIRNRLTHSLEVAQIARSIAADIGYEQQELYVVEACSLAHDMGNPPFGHNGERVLNDIINDKCREIGLQFCDVEGFEGNAQTLRILTTLSGKGNSYKGLNLTYRSLLGVVKYFTPFCSGEGANKKYIYKPDFEIINDICKYDNILKKTLDVQIMDISDEIAYAAHDIEDTLKNRKFTIEEFIQEFKTNKELEEKYGKEKVKEASEYIQDKLVNEARCKVSGNSTQYNDLFCKELGSLIIYNLIREIDLIERDGNKELGFKNWGIIADGLKRITFECVNRGNEVKYYELKGRIILEDLFKYFYNHEVFLPREYQELIEGSSREAKEKSKLRAVVDYISGMMDGYAALVHKKIYGEDRFKIYGFMEQKV